MTCEDVVGKKVSWRGQLRRIVGIERETEKAVLAKIRNVRGLTDEEDEMRWEEYRKKQMKMIKEYLEVAKSERRKKEAEENLKALEEGWEELVWVPKSILFLFFSILVQSTIYMEFVMTKF